MIPAAIVMLVGLFAWRQRMERPVPAGPGFRVVTAVEQTLERTLRVTGQMAARRSATFVAPKLRGSRRGASNDFRMTLLDILRPGTRVKPGDVVARIDPQYLINRADDGRADVHERELINRRIDSSTEIRRTQLEHRIRVAEANVEKARLNVKTIPVRSAIAAERFRLALEEAQAQLNQLMVERQYFDQSERSQLRREELALRDVQLDLSRAEANVERMTFRTSIGGVVVMGQTQRGTEMGEIEAGDEVHSGHAFLQVMDTASLYLDAIVNQVDEESVRPGAPAVIRLDAVPGLEIPAHVYTMGATATANRYRPAWVRHLAVKIFPDRFEHRNVANFSGSADIVTASEHGVTLPRECISQAGGRASVDLASRDAEGNLIRERREVQLGLASHLRAVIRSGIRAGDAVACP